MVGEEKSSSSQPRATEVRADGSVVTWGCPASGGDSSAVAEQLSAGVQSLARTLDPCAGTKSCLLSLAGRRVACGRFCTRLRSQERRATHAPRTRPPVAPAPRGAAPQGVPLGGRPRRRRREAGASAPVCASAPPRSQTSTKEQRGPCGCCALEPPALGAATVARRRFRVQGLRV